MSRFIVQRVLYGVLTLLLVSLLVFSATELLPGDAAQAVLGQNATPELLATMRERLNLDEPAPLRYALWLEKVLRGDFGDSLATGRSVWELISDRLENTLFLAGFAGLLIIPIALSLGIFSALNAGRRIDAAISIATLGAVAMPEFLLAIVLVYFFAVATRWLPTTSLIRTGDSLGETIRKLALPGMTLGLIATAHMVRMTRSIVLNALKSPYVEMALLKGLSRKRIMLVHILSNAIAPIVSVFALVAGYLMAGVVVVETVFSFPGLGRLMADSVAIRDLPVVQACAMIFGLGYVLLNLIADLIAILCNPKLARGG